MRSGLVVLGEEALAATVNAHLIMGLLYSFVLGFGMAAMILVGQAFGRGNLDEARRVLGTAVGGFLPLVTALAATGWLTCPRIVAADDDAGTLLSPRSRLPEDDLRRTSSGHDDNHAHGHFARRW
jgi:hypothetical protein